MLTDVCDVCNGNGTPISGRPCMCQGTGKMSEAAVYLRKELVTTEANLREETRRVATIHKSLEAVAVKNERLKNKIRQMCQEMHNDEKVNITWTTMAIAAYLHDEMQ